MIISALQDVMDGRLLKRAINYMSNGCYCFMPAGGGRASQGWSVGGEGRLYYRGCEVVG